MRALSGMQPWWLAIIHLGKRIENRVEASSSHKALRTYRSPFLLHASARVGTRQDFDDAVSSIGNIIGNARFEEFRAAYLDVKYYGDCDSWYIPNEAVPLGCIVGRARCVGLITPDGDPFDLEARAAIERLKPDMRWHIPGQWGHILDDVVPAPIHVPCKGALGLWEVPAAVIDQLKTAAAHAR